MDEPPRNRPARSSTRTRAAGSSADSFLAASKSPPFLVAVGRALRPYRPCVEATSARTARAWLETSESVVGAVLGADDEGLAVAEHLRVERGFRGPMLVVTGLGGTSGAETAALGAAYDLDARVLGVADALARLPRFARTCLLRAQTGSDALARAVDLYVERYGLGPLETEVVGAALAGRRADWFRIEHGTPEGTYRARVNKLLKRACADSLDEVVRELLREALDIAEARSEAAWA